MKRKYLFLLVFFISKLISAQKVDNSLLAFFYNLAIRDVIKEDPIARPFTIIRTGFDTALLSKSIGVNKLKYINNNYKIQKALPKPLRKARQIPTYYISDSIFSNDTVEIIVATVIVDYATKRNVDYFYQYETYMNHATRYKYVYDRKKLKWVLWEIIKRD